MGWVTVLPISALIVAVYVAFLIFIPQMIIASTTFSLLIRVLQVLFVDTAI